MGRRRYTDEERAISREKLRQKQKAQYRAERDLVLSKLGGKCECCQETTREFLCIDHRDGGGSIERKKYGDKSTHIRVLRSLVVPPDLRLLCANCNQAMSVTAQYYGVSFCPHHNLDFENTVDSRSDYEWDTTNEIFEVVV